MGSMKLADIRTKTIQLFWDKVYVRSIEECWMWLGCNFPSGYGQLNVNGVAQRAHRFSYIIHKGDIPEGLYVLHKCDYPACVNPHHLSVGTQKDNLQDMSKKGRYKNVDGENHPQHKLTSEQVLSIRKLYAEGEYTQVQLADTFGVGKTVIGVILNRQGWTHI